jgi:hypothetical protein
MQMIEDEPNGIDINNEDDQPNAVVGLDSELSPRLTKQNSSGIERQEPTRRIDICPSEQKQTSTDGTDYKTPTTWPSMIIQNGRRIQDPSAKCHACFSAQIKCDGGRPCQKCVKQGYRCREQGQLLQLKDKSTYCDCCFRYGQKCDGARPCSRCIKNRAHCREQGQPVQYRIVKQPRAPTGQDPQTKCHCCFNSKSRCDGERPCNRCVKERYQCREQGQARQLKDSSMKCYWCFVQRKKCNGRVVAVRRARLDVELKERQEVKSRRCLFGYRSQARNVQLNAHEAIRSSLNSVILLASLLN